MLYRAKKFFSSDLLYLIYCTLILPYLSYCCEVWGNNYKTRLQCINVLQKRAIRIIGNVGYRDQIAPVFYKLHALNLVDILNLRLPVRCT